MIDASFSNIKLVLTFNRMCLEMKSFCLPSSGLLVPWCSLTAFLIFWFCSMRLCCLGNIYFDLPLIEYPALSLFVSVSWEYYKSVFVLGSHWISFNFKFSRHCFCFFTLLMLVLYVGPSWCWSVYFEPSDMFSFGLLHFSKQT